jgi:hypothetical protein
MDKEIGPKTLSKKVLDRLAREKYSIDLLANGINDLKIVGRVILMKLLNCSVKS